MPETPNTQGDKGRKTRPFGSFLLFLTVLVVILIAFGGEHLGRAEPLTQDQFEWLLYTGEVEHMTFRGEKEIEGEKPDGSRFTVSFSSLDGKQGLYQQLNAIRRYHPIAPAQLVEAIATKWYAPERYRHLIAVTDSATEFEPASESDSDEAVAPVPLPVQEDRLFVSVTARSESAWNGSQSSAPDFPLPATSGQLWLEVVDGDDLGSLKEMLGGMGAVADDKQFDLRATYGTLHGAANTSMAQVLLIWGPWILIFGVFLLFMRQMRQQGPGAGVMSFGRSRAQLYAKEDATNVTFDDVAGVTEAKDEVEEVVEFLRNPGRFTRIGGRIPRGVLLVGPPGCGKTLLAKAIAGEAEVPFFSISGSDFVEMFVGVGASRVRDLFKQARESSPCIIFLDEIDAVGRRRGGGMGGGHDEREQTLNAILVEMDGFSTDEGIIVVAATNRPDVLDPALLRPGRFDREVTIDLPDIEGRKAILDVHLKRVKIDDHVDSEVLARSTPGYSGADLAAIINEAAIMAVLAKKEVIGMVHLEEATAKVRYGREKKSRKVEEQDRKITAYHEAGHTIVAALLDEVDMPHKVTIVPRGRALGSTMMLPKKESYHTQKKRLLGQLAMAFGGRVAEAMFCGDISAGASDDIRRATELARAMVTELGMSEKIGPINYAERQGSDFLGTELMSSKWHSEETARAIDKEVELILRNAYTLAEEIISEQREGIERLTEALLRYETLKEDEIANLIAGTSPDDLRPPASPPDEPSPQPAPTTRPETRDGHAGRADELDDLPGDTGLSPA
ncbi:MAG: cell division protease FtsH [Chlamydiales bacterium]|jgi:cell division protease FtsH